MKEYDVIVRVAVYDDETLEGVLESTQKYGGCSNAEVVSEVAAA